MAERELSIIIRAKDFFTGAFNKLRDSVLGAKTPLDQMAASTTKLEQPLEKVRRGCHAAKQSVDALGQSAEKSQGIFGRLGGFLRDHFVITLGDITGAVRSVVHAITGLAERATVVEGVSRQFDSLAKSVGSTGDAFLGKLRAGTQGAVSDLDLMKSANQSLLIGLNLTGPQMEKVAGAAVKLGQATGKTAADALDTLVRGLGGQERTLKTQLGIIVDTEKATLDYAVSVGKTTDSLTEAEKRAVFLTAALEAVDRKVSGLANVKVSPVEQLGATFDNLKGKLATTLVQSDAFQSSMERLAKTVADPKVADGIAQIASAAGTLSSAVAADFGATGRDIDRLSEGIANFILLSSKSALQAKDLSEEQRKAVEAVLEPRHRLNRAVADGIEFERRDAETLQRLIAATNEVAGADQGASEATLTLEQRIQRLIAAQNSATGSAVELSKTVAAAFASFGLAGDQAADVLAGEQANQILKARIALLRTLGADERDLIAAENALNRAREQGPAALLALVDAGDQAAKAIGAVSEAAKDGKSALDNLGTSAKSSFSGLQEAAKELGVDLHLTAEGAREINRAILEADLNKLLSDPNVSAQTRLDAMKAFARFLFDGVIPVAREVGKALGDGVAAGTARAQIAVNALIATFQAAEAAGARVGDRVNIGGGGTRLLPRPGETIRVPNPNSPGGTILQTVPFRAGSLAPSQPSRFFDHLTTQN